MIKRLEQKNYKTSMTTNLKNIMRRQQKDLLITSSNLLHTVVLQDILKGTQEERIKPSSSQNKRLMRPASSYALIKRSQIAENKPKEQKGKPNCKISIYKLNLIIQQYKELE